MQRISTDELRQRVAQRFLVIAHRGYSSAFRENSLKAFEQAIAAGADIIEADVRQSIDEALMLSHSEVKNAAALDLEEQGVIRLEALLRLAKDRIVLLLDMKDENSSTLEKALDAIEHHGMEDQVVFGLRSPEQTHAFRALNSNIVVVGFLSPRHYDFEAFFQAGGDIARLWERDADANRVATARGDAGRHPIWITPRARPAPTGHLDQDRQVELMKRGFDGVLVNDPESAIETRCRYYDAVNQR